ncbi:hypothetical protein [Staphylococcus pasteuri]|nr:hypothetical protein [Staphylococcus pasteuri]
MEVVVERVVEGISTGVKEVDSEQDEVEVVEVEVVEVVDEVKVNC